MSNFRSAGLLLAAVGGLAPATALGTYSIVATDRATRYVGGAVTSCVPGSVAGVYDSAPGIGAVASQAFSSNDGRAFAVSRLLMNVAPEQIIAEIRARNFRPGGEATQQYGIADLMGRAAGHSGVDNGDFADDIQGSFQGFTYSIQGNILTGRAVLTQAQAAFQRNDACDLAERLMLALEAGADNNEGDNRCIDRFGTPSHSASIQVDRPGEPKGSYLRLSVVPQRMNANPLPGLRAEFDDWRRRNPCPASPPDANAPPPRDAGQGPPSPPSSDAAGAPVGLDAGGGGGSGGSTPRPPDSGGTQGGGRMDGSTGSGGSGSGQGGSAGSPGPVGPGPAMPGAGGGAGSVPPTGQTPEPMPAGCECRVGGGSPGLAALFFAALLLLIRRRL
jgi:MYXO-CTERM domain-containing protein